MSSSPFEEELRQQVEQERLINQVTSLIRQSLELPIILETAVQEVRKFLNADRLIIYQFNISAPSCPVDFSTPRYPWMESISLEGTTTIPQLDGITYEACANESIPSVLHLLENAWLTNATNLRQKYQAGQTTRITDTEADAADLAVYFLPRDQTQVRAELVTPILVQNELWGLLIVHQCHTARRWTDRDQHCLQRIAEHLAIAIHQANLYAELHQQKETLEQKVFEQTQHLRDALFAAQSADRAKSEFLATISHELRTPLTCVIGMAATLLRQLPEHRLPIEKQQAFLETIRDRGEHLLTLINDMLELSQVETGRTMLEVREFSIVDLASQTLRQLQDTARRKQISLNFECRGNADNPQRRFLGDPRRIYQVLLNLLSNALKFTPENGTVTLRIWQATDSAILQVEDTGIGIPEHQRSLLFQKFQQLDPSHQRRYEGTGLGLALTKQLIELHGGTIEVQSAVGQGSIFTVHLPNQVRSALDYARSREPISPLPILHQRIMLIESDESTANLICDLLNPAEYQVVWMTEPDLAMHHLDTFQPRLVIVAQPIASEIWHSLKKHPLPKPPKLLVIRPENQSSTVRILPSIPGLEVFEHPIVQPEAFIDKVAALTSGE